jgi:hypothetical protein
MATTTSLPAPDPVQVRTSRPSAAQAARRLASFYAFDPGFRGGVFVSAGNTNGDDRDDIITGAGPSAGPHVRVFNSADGAELFSFYAFDPGFTGGVRVGSGDIDSDGRADIIAGAGPGAGPHVRAFSGVDLNELASFYAYPASFPGGVFVAGYDSDSSAVQHAAPASGFAHDLAIGQLRSIHAAAVQRFAEAGVAGPQLDLLRSVGLHVADLPDDLLGLVRGDTVLIDRDAAGRGWFIDPTPLADDEVTSDGRLTRNSLNVDLLSAVMRELDFMLGNPSTVDELMFADFGAGVRRLPDLVDAALAGW